MRTAYWASLTVSSPTIISPRRRRAASPASEEVERVGGVRPEEVAVDRLQPGPPRRLDPLEGNLDGLAAPADEVENSRQVGVDAEQLVEVTALLRPRPRLAEEGDARLGLVAPAEADTESRRGVEHHSIPGRAEGP